MLGGNTRSSERCSLSGISANDGQAADLPDGSSVTFRCLLPPVAPALPSTELTQGLSRRTLNHQYNRNAASQTSASPPAARASCAASIASRTASSLSRYSP
jgi:hypothetical protein